MRNGGTINAVLCLRMSTIIHKGKYTSIGDIFKLPYSMQLRSTLPPSSALLCLIRGIEIWRNNPNIMSIVQCNGWMQIYHSKTVMWRLRLIDIQKYVSRRGCPPLVLYIYLIINNTRCHKIRHASLTIHAFNSLSQQTYRQKPLQVILGPPFLSLLSHKKS